MLRPLGHFTTGLPLKNPKQKKKGWRKSRSQSLTFFFIFRGFEFTKKKGYSRNRPKCCKIKKNSGWTIGLYIGLQSVLSGSVTVDSQIVDYPVTSLQELWREFVCRPISRGHALPWKKTWGLSPNISRLTASGGGCRSVDSAVKRIHPDLGNKWKLMWKLCSYIRQSPRGAAELLMKTWPYRLPAFGGQRESQYTTRTTTTTSTQVCAVYIAAKAPSLY